MQSTLASSPLASSSQTILKQKRKSLSTPSSPCSSSPQSKHSRPTISLPQSRYQHAPSAVPDSMDCDMIESGSSSADESMPSTPSFFGNMQDPFAMQAHANPVFGAGPTVVPTWQQQQIQNEPVGLLGAKGRAGHGPGCTTIPKIVLGEPNATTGKRSLWSVCQSCGAVAVEDCSKW